MTKDDLIEAVRKKLDISRRAAYETVNLVFDSIVAALKRGESATITGFGTFRVGKRAARSGINPRTGAKIQIPAMNVPKFKAGKELKEAVK